MESAVDFEAFRQPLNSALDYYDACKSGRAPYDRVAMFKVLILTAQTLARKGHPINGRPIHSFSQGTNHTMAATIQTKFRFSSA